MLNKDIEKNIRIMFPENAEDRTQRILRRLRDDKAKDEHVAGSLTWIGRCAVDHAAADLIEQLEANIPRWISLEERLPEGNDDVLVFVQNPINGHCWTQIAHRLSAMALDECDEYDEWWLDGSGETVRYITHWMPLPEAPEEE